MFIGKLPAGLGDAAGADSSLVDANAEPSGVGSLDSAGSDDSRPDSLDEAKGGLPDSFVRDSSLFDVVGPDGIPPDAWQPDEEFPDSVGPDAPQDSASPDPDVKPADGW